ncbi:MAG: S-adenosylmethionine:tRNA ribosyltransferase-isomerase [Patescibacteria group bacterium]
MNTKFIQLLRNYNYTLPRERIALAPASPRDSARLLIYNKGKKEINDDRFTHLTRYLPPRSVLVLNQTKVIPARFMVTKPTGGKANLLYVEMSGNEIKVLSEKKLSVGTKLVAPARYEFLVERQRGSVYFLKPLFPLKKLAPFLNRYGVTPIPFYLRHTPLTESALRQKYQTMFARVPGSIAAPTASLHFTPRLIKKLKALGHTVKYITLHVSLGTFAPLTEAQTRKGALHQEWYSIDRRTADCLNRAKHRGRPIIAVGTTVVRALESATKTPQLSPPYQEPVPCLSREGAGERVSTRARTTLVSLHGATNLFIRPRYRFRFIDGIITNFHVPHSSLLMLVAAFVGRDKLFSLYRRAIRKRYAFFSFGDGMLLY